MTDTRKKSATEFVQRWTSKGYEKGESQQFWLNLLVNVYEVPNITGFITFENKSS